MLMLNDCLSIAASVQSNKCKITFSFSRVLLKTLSDLRSNTGRFSDACISLFQGNLDQERLKKQQELAAAAALYQQLQQQQIFQLINR